MLSAGLSIRPTMCENRAQPITMKPHAVWCCVRALCSRKTFTTVP